ncbi:MAG TPA: M48 family metallopeptidase [Pseudonocardiaceae bacterium]|jgi:Zn-dependent protease with chaperone function|nr:M48 family metallopeptidase [Pseudonocardiaceae bacterium]
MESTGASHDILRGASRVRFPGISPRAYEHPADRGALAALRSVPGFPVVLKAVAGAFTERGERLMSLASSVRVGPRQYPMLHELRAECAEILDIDPVPEMFVMRHPDTDAMTMGIDRPFVVLTTGLLQAADEGALRNVIGHELGHVLSGHALYRTMLFRLIRMLGGVSWLPGGYWSLRAIIAALREWYRKAELSADRAGLLCSQDPAAALRMHMLLAGANSPGDVDPAAFLGQAADYEAEGDIRDSVLKLMNTVDLTHPMVVVRAAELQKWAASEEYRAILSGDYPRREDQPPRAWSDDVKAAARSYRDSFHDSTDPLAKVLGDVGGVISDTAGKVWQRFGGRSTPGDD